jgi:acyl carrier protein
MHNELQAIKNALVTTLNLTEDTEIHVETKLKEDLGLDSMSTLSFLMALEEGLPGFMVDPDTLDTRHLVTVCSVMEYVKGELVKTA